LLFVFAPTIAVAAVVFVSTAAVRGGGNEDTVGNSDCGGKKNTNQLKAAAATMTETAKMTATTMMMKMKATAPLTAAQRWRWQRAGGGESAAEVGSAINIFQTRIVCCLIECFHDDVVLLIVCIVAKQYSIFLTKYSILE
jgi:hypothetical protein